jgi:1,2-diacylglycerol 3-alpha-glucosyltransferase
VDRKKPQTGAHRKRGMLIAVCFERFGPYHAARLAAAAQRMNVVGIEVSANTRDYAWDLVHSGEAFRRIVVVPEGNLRALPKDAQRHRVWQVMDALGPHVVAVHGWSEMDALLVLAWAADRQVPVVMMSESTPTDFRRWASKEWIKRRLVRLAQAGLVGGTVHAAYIMQLGMAGSRVFKGYDVVDNSYFARMAALRRSTERPDRLPSHNYFLASNRFLPKKNLHRLLKAFALYSRVAGRQGWELVLLGDGDLRPELERQRIRLGLKSVVHMPGFMQYGDLPDYYAWAGAFVHTSTTEQWGLVVNEAMASGLPVLVSERCGCVPDLVENARNGFTFDPYDVGALANLMLKLSTDDCDRAAMGRASREIIGRWSPDTFAEGLAQAAQAALSSGRPQAGRLDKALLWALSCR